MSPAAWPPDAGRPPPRYHTLSVWPWTSWRALLRRTYLAMVTASSASATGSSTSARGHDSGHGRIMAITNGHPSSWLSTAVFDVQHATSCAWGAPTTGSSCLTPDTRWLYGAASTASRYSSTTGSTTLKCHVDGRTGRSATASQASTHRSGAAMPATFSCRDNHVPVRSAALPSPASHKGPGPAQRGLLGNDWDNSTGGQPRTTR